MHRTPLFSASPLKPTCPKKKKGEKREKKKKRKIATRKTVMAILLCSERQEYQRLRITGVDRRKKDTPREKRSEPQAADTRTKNDARTERKGAPVSHFERQLLRVIYARIYFPINPIETFLYR